MDSRTSLVCGHMDVCCWDFCCLWTLLALIAESVPLSQVTTTFYWTFSWSTVWFSRNQNASVFAGVSNTAKLYRISSEVEKTPNHSSLDYILWRNKDFSALLFLVMVLSKRSPWDCMRVWIFKIGKHCPLNPRVNIQNWFSWPGTGIDQVEYWLVHCSSANWSKSSLANTLLDGTHTSWQSFCQNPYVNHPLGSLNPLICQICQDMFEPQWWTEVCLKLWFSVKYLNAPTF